MRRSIAWIRHHRLFVSGVASLIVIGLLLGTITHWRSNIDEERRFAAVEPVMTEEEVLTILGKPPGQYGPPGARYGRSMWFG